MEKNTTGIISYWKSLLYIYKSTKHHIKSCHNTLTPQQVESSVVTNIVVFPQQKVIYIKYPKNGGTSILRHILDKKSSLVKYHYKDYPKQFENWLNRMTDETLQKEYFIFGIVRNPYQRLESAFQYIYPKSKETFSQLFISKFTKEYNHHWVPQYIVCKNQNIFDYIGRMETSYDDSVRVLLKILQIDNVIEIPHANKSIRKAQNPKCDEDPELLLQVNKFYKKDFELFNYMVIQ